MTVTNAAFTMRVLNAAPARVFAAFASLEAKSDWFKAPSDIDEAVKSRKHDTTWHIDNLVAALDGRRGRASS